MHFQFMSALLIPVKRQHGDDEQVSCDYSIEVTFSSKDQKKRAHLTGCIKQDPAGV